jgi:hypothetical protein
MIRNNVDDIVVEFSSKNSKNTSSIHKIWGAKICSHGYIGIPLVLIQAQSRLHINPIQMNIIIQLLSYWIDPTRKPFPTKKELADRMGVTDNDSK